MTTLRRQQSFGAPYLLLFLFGVVLLAISLGVPAKGLRLEVGLGRTVYGNAGTNIWWDQGYPTNNALTTHGGTIGVSGDFNYRFGWRAWLVDFGTAASTACFPSDPDYFAHDGAPCLYDAQGSGHAYALTVGPTINFHPTYSLTLTLEGGAALYRARWDESVSLIGSGVWKNCDSFSAVGVTRTGWTLYDGIGAAYKHVFVSYRRYRDIYAKDAVFGNAVAQTLVGVRFGF